LAYISSFTKNMYSWAIQNLHTDNGHEFDVFFNIYNDI